jgi:hypothetical protein
VSMATMFPGVCIYLALATALIWLRIGSIQARRWARALLLIFSWSWLMVGIFDVVIMTFLLPKIMANLPTRPGVDHPAVAASAMTMIIVFTLAFSAFFMVVLPAIWTFFYQSRHVKLTCEWRDPQLRWTDACPLSVLGLCLWLFFSAFMMIVMVAMPYIAVPFFGIFLSGAAARITYLVVGGLWLFAAWLLYRLDARGWWIALTVLLGFAISSTITYSLHSIMDMYRLMHYPEAQLEQMQKTGLLQGNTMIWITPLFMLPLLGYMIFIKRYLR